MVCFKPCASQICICWGALLMESGGRNRPEGLGRGPFRHLSKRPGNTGAIKKKNNNLQFRVLVTSIAGLRLTTLVWYKTWKRCLLLLILLTVQFVPATLVSCFAQALRGGSLP